MEGLHCVLVIVLLHLITGSVGVECPDDGQHFFPHPYTCSQFIECQGGVSRDVDCIDGLHFSPDLGWCDFPENVGCVDSTPAPPNVGGPVGECQDENGAYVDFLPDSKYCNVFYKCDWGSPVRKLCPDTTYFNPAINVCDWPWNVDCTGQISDDENSNDNENDTDDGIPDDNQGEDDTGDSGEENGTSGEVEEGSGDIEENVPEDGDEGDEDDSVPNEEDVSESSEDNTGNKVQGICPSDGQYWLPHPYNCSQFIECNGGNYIEADCIDGFHFNPELGWCDFPENVGCVDSTPALPTTTAAPTTGGPVGDCAPLNGEYAEFLPDSLYCDVYYMCVWGEPVKMPCPPGLHFNPLLNVCDWPHDAGCTAGQ